jgi:hypothetical protein
MDLLIRKKIADNVPDFYYHRIATGSASRASRVNRPYKFYELSVIGSDVVIGVFRGIYGTMLYIYCVTRSRICLKTSNNSNVIVFDFDGNVVIDPEIKSDMAFVGHYGEKLSTLSSVIDIHKKFVDRRTVPFKWLQHKDDIVRRMTLAQHVDRPIELSDLIVVCMDACTDARPSE